LARTARPTKATSPEANGFWDRPPLMDLVADLLFLLAAAALGWAGVVTVRTLPIFPLREIVIQGDLTQVTRAQIEQAARTAAIGNFFTVDLDHVQSSFEKLPWVRHADVRRRWPSAVELTLEEHVAVARWRHVGAGNSQESRLVNGFGEVFAAASAEELPAFAGPEGSAAEVLDRYRQCETALTPLGRHADVVQLSRRQAWQVKLDSGLVIELGRDEDKHPLAERLARFVTYFGPAMDKTHLTEVAVADMRYPNGFALRVARKS
jgi:cell division protein FtsQ